jgi:hypothetical protein
MPTLFELTTWAEKCRSAADGEDDPEAKQAYQELAREFEAVVTEIDGLLEAFEAIQARRVPA